MYKYVHTPWSCWVIDFLTWSLIFKMPTLYTVYIYILCTPILLCSKLYHTYYIEAIVSKAGNHNHDGVYIAKTSYKVSNISMLL